MLWLFSFISGGVSLFSLPRSATLPIIGFLAVMFAIWGTHYIWQGEREFGSTDDFDNE